MGRRHQASRWNSSGTSRLFCQHTRRGRQRAYRYATRGIATKETLVVLIMWWGADPSKRGPHIVDLSNQFVKGMFEYPKDMASAESLLELYKPPSTTHSMTRRQQPPRVAGTATRAASSEASALTFTQQGPTHAERVAASVAGTDGVIHPGITCRSGCQGKCPGATTTGLMQYSLMLAQSNGSSSDPRGILLDSQSTISVFKNPAMLTNIRRSKHTLRALTNGAHQDSNMFGDFPNLGKGFSTTASQSQT
jgi:hypothetical protein